MVLMPTYAFHLESFATLLTTDGQTEVEVKVVPNIHENPCDIVWDRNQPVPISRNLAQEGCFRYQLLVPCQ